MDKVKHYVWVKPGDLGEVRMIPIGEIRFDYSYQRKEVSEKNTLGIAKEFNWSAFGIVTVMERDNGHLYCVDGEQRIFAAKRREDIQSIPCMVFKSDGKEHEAQAFLNINVHRRYVSAAAKFRASIKANQEPEKSIAQWLANQELTILENGKSLNAIDFPAVLIRFWKFDQKASQESLILQRNIIGPMESMNSFIHRGLWYLLHRQVDIGPHVEKLRKLGGKPALLRSINAITIETGMSHRNERSCALGILSLINYRRQNKIRIQEQG